METTDPERARSDLHSRIPAAMRNAQRWLLWRSVPPAGGGKPRKLPFYADGSPRRGTLDSVDDTARLASFDRALAALNTGDFTGLGFALGPDGPGNWQGVDLDGLSRHPELARLVDRLPGYVERSPSGDGLHAIGYGVSFEALGSNSSGVEAYTRSRFFTVTGSAIGTGTIEDIGPFVATVLAPIHGKVPATRTVGKGASGSSVFAKINAKALANLSAWVPAVFPAAKAYHDGFRISSRDLGRDLEEALSILPAGIRDFGEERGLTPIDLVLEWGPATSPREAALSEDLISPFSVRRVRTRKCLFCSRV